MEKHTSDIGAKSAQSNIWSPGYARIRDVPIADEINSTNTEWMDEIPTTDSTYPTRATKWHPIFLPRLRMCFEVGVAVVCSPPPALQPTNDDIVPAAPVFIACTTSPEKETTVRGWVIVNLIGEGRDDNRE